MDDYQTSADKYCIIQSCFSHTIVLFANAMMWLCFLRLNELVGAVGSVVEGRGFTESSLPGESLRDSSSPQLFRPPRWRRRSAPCVSDLQLPGSGPRGGPAGDGADAAASAPRPQPGGEAVRQGHLHRRPADQGLHHQVWAARATSWGAGPGRNPAHHTHVYTESCFIGQTLN